MARARFAIALDVMLWLFLRELKVLLDPHAHAPGTCAIVWSDASPPTLLALYHPQTRLTCFHPSGAARLLCDDEGYTSFSPTGSAP
jgi:hypothetical protein